jgi:hypothetical protein
MMKKFDFVAVLEAIQKYKITTLTMVPPIAVVCLSNPNSTSGRRVVSCLMIHAVPTIFADNNSGTSKISNNENV